MVVVLDETGTRLPYRVPVSSSAPAAPADQPGALVFLCHNCCLEHPERFCTFCGSTSLELVSA